MTSSLDRARKWINRYGYAFSPEVPYEKLAALLDAVAADARRVALREIHVRIREVMMHPTVKDMPIPAALWHLMRNLEHETGDRPIGLVTAPEHVGDK